MIIKPVTSTCFTRPPALTSSVRSGDMSPCFSAAFIMARQMRSFTLRVQVEGGQWEGSELGCMGLQLVGQRRLKTLWGAPDVPWGSIIGA